MLKKLFNLQPCCKFLLKTKVSCKEKIITNVDNCWHQTTPNMLIKSTKEILQQAAKLHLNLNYQLVSNQVEKVRTRQFKVLCNLLNFLINCISQNRNSLTNCSFKINKKISNYRSNKINFCLLHSHLRTRNHS